MRNTKYLKIYIPALVLFGLVLLSAVARPVNAAGIINVDIVSPANMGKTKMASPVMVKTDMNATCDYKLDGGSAHVFRDTGTMVHIDNLVGVSAGSHSLLVSCTDGGSNSGSSSVTWIKLSPTGTILYGVNSAGQDAANPHDPSSLLTINPETGDTISEVGPIGYKITGLAFHPQTGVLYGSSGGQDNLGGKPKSLFTINTSTGAGTYLGTVKDLSDTSQILADITFDADGTLYGWSETGDDLYTVNISSCNGVVCLATKVGESNTSTFGSGITFDNQGKLQYFGQSDQYYYEVNKSTGLLTQKTFINHYDENNIHTWVFNAATIDETGMIFTSRINQGNPGPATDLVVMNTDEGINASLGQNPDMQFIDGLAFYLSDKDTDGLVDSSEDSAPNNGDGNGDGIPDGEQSNVTSTTNPVTGSGTYVTVESTGTCPDLSGVSQQPSSSFGTDGTFSYPLGLTGLTTTCSSPGQSAQIKVFYDKQYDTSAWVARKYAKGSFVNIPGAVFATATVGSKTVTTLTYSLTDGGELDEDGTANGIIVDPAGPAVITPGAAVTGLPNTGVQRVNLYWYLLAVCSGIGLIWYGNRQNQVFKKN